MNYALKAIFERSSTTRLLSELSQVLMTKSAERIRALTWEPAKIIHREAPSGTTFVWARGIDGLDLESFEQGNNYHFQLDSSDLRPFYEDSVYQPCSQPGAPGTCACLLTSFFGSEKYLILELTSQIDEISQLLESSDEIHDQWRSYCQASGALAGYVDRECEEALMVFPERRSINVPDFFSIHPSDDLHYSSDLMVERIMESNDLRA